MKSRGAQHFLKQTNKPTFLLCLLIPTMRGICRVNTCSISELVWLQVLGTTWLSPKCNPSQVFLSSALGLTRPWSTYEGGRLLEQEDSFEAAVTLTGWWHSAWLWQHMEPSGPSGPPTPSWLFSLRTGLQGEPGPCIWCCSLRLLVSVKTENH